MTDFGRHFKPEEFLCPCGAKTCVGQDMNQGFLGKLNRFRDMYGKPLKVVHGGGYRCKAYNLSIGGEPDGYHPQGRATDLEVPNDSDKERYLMLRIAFSIFGGVGVNNGALHVDDRNQADARCWDYYDLYKKK